MHQIQRVGHNNHQTRGDKAKPNMPDKNARDKASPALNIDDKPLSKRIINKQTRRIAMLWLGWFV
jgi:hypothetical protein